MDSEKISQYLDMSTDWAVTFIPKILIACLILFIGFKLIAKIGKYINSLLSKSNFGPEVSSVLASTLIMFLKITVIGVAASFIGIKMTALIGLAGAAVFAIGMALQGFMGNFASGLTILFFKPYRIGDWVSLDDSFGKVSDIQIFYTTLGTPNDKTLVIPNGKVTDSIITNYSVQGNIRIELNVTMPYEESYPKVKEVIMGALKESQYVVWDKEPKIGIETYDSHSIVLSIRPYIHPDNYWDATYEMYGLIKNAFHKNQIRAAYSEGVELGPIGA